MERDDHRGHSRQAGPAIGRRILSLMVGRHRRDSVGEVKATRPALVATRPMCGATDLGPAQADEKESADAVKTRMKGARAQAISAAETGDLHAAEDQGHVQCSQRCTDRCPECAKRDGRPRYAILHQRTSGGGEGRRAQPGGKHECGHMRQVSRSHGRERQCGRGAGGGGGGCRGVSAYVAGFVWLCAFTLSVVTHVCCAVVPFTARLLVHLAGNHALPQNSMRHLRGNLHPQASPPRRGAREVRAMHARGQDGRRRGLRN